MANRIAFLSRLPLLALFSKTLGIEYLSTRLPLLALFSKTLGIEYLSKSGFEVFFLDISYLIDGLAEQDLYEKQENLTECNNIVIRKFDQLKTFVKENTKNTIFIDFTSGLSEFNLNTSHVFKILKESKARYYIISNGAIPTGCYSHDNFTSEVFLKIKKAVKKPKLIFDFIARKLIVQLSKLNILYQKPHRIFGIQDSPQIISYIKKYGINNSVINKINSRDYDLYLEYLVEKHKLDAGTDICVFLDEDLTNHPDFFIFGVPPLNKDKYVSTINNFFDYVEEKTNLKVIIAAHPKSKYSAQCHPYGERKFIKGQTVQLVARSKMVISHSSTSVSFPVLFGKPILLVVTNEMKNRIDMINSVNAFAKELGVVPLEIDSVDEFFKFDALVNRDINYKNYLHKYVKNKEPINKSTWEIVAEAVRID